MVFRPANRPREGEMKEANYRNFLKDAIRKELDFSGTEQNRGLPPPPVEKPFPAGGRVIALPGPDAWPNLGSLTVREAIEGRKSVRNYSRAPLALDELAFLLWATQGIRSRVIKGHAFRTVPSAGCRHSFETYLAVFRVAGLEKGLYRYLPLSHSLLCLESVKDLETAAAEAALGQGFVGAGAVTFIWTTLPARMEWRYGPASYKVIALDAGHVCQNLYLACRAVGAGTCAIAAYDQEKADALVGADGREEFVIYLAPVGKLPER